MRKPAALKPTATTPPAAKTAKKAAPEAATKAAPKVAPKVAANAAPKAVKPAPKAATPKPAAKSVATAAVKTAVKTAAKAPAKAAAKTPAKPAARAAAPKAAKPTRAPRAKAGAVADEPVREKAPKANLIRDSFTMPEHEYEVLGKVKRACLKAGFEIKKSELLRIGVALISQMDMATLQRVLGDLPQLKTGRPRKA